MSYRCIRGFEFYDPEADEAVQVRKGDEPARVPEGRAQELVDLGYLVEATDDQGGDGNGADPSEDSGDAGDDGAQRVDEDAADTEPDDAESGDSAEDDTDDDSPEWPEGLPPVAIEGLKRAGIEPGRVGELSDDRLLSIDGVGPMSLRVLRGGES